MSKIHLSSQEMLMITDSQWILTKHKIISKVYELFGILSEEYKRSLADDDPFPLQISKSHARISKGENYMGLPYVMMDYPATFSREGVLAVRTMFWWGNFLSITLHASGNYKINISSGAEPLSFLKKHTFFIGSGKEWDHHFEEWNYTGIEDVSSYQTVMNTRSYLKLAKKIDLKEWDRADTFLIQTFGEIAAFMRISYRAGKKDPLPGSPTTGFDP